MIPREPVSLDYLRLVLFLSSSITLEILLLGFIGKEQFAFAQINPDNTLGSESSQVTPNVDIKGIPADQINGGAIRGANLFHSFSEFNVSEGQRVYFANPRGINQILSRVTGNNLSTILGTLGVLGNANLFLINPHGIIFGPNAQLDVNGSFVASTADSLVFGNGFAFSATNPQAPPLLTVNIPLGLQYGSSAGNIEVQGSFLQIPEGQTLALMGGNVSLHGAFLLAPGSRIELGGLSAEGTVGLSLAKELNFNFPQKIARANVSLDGAFVDVTGIDRGSIAINAQDVTLQAQSGLFAGILPGAASLSSQAGDIEIQATGDIILDQDSFIQNALYVGGIGKSGNINITTDSLALTNGAAISASTGGEGNAGNLNIRAVSSVYLDGLSAFLSIVDRGAVGNGGNINITTDSLVVTDGAVVVTSTNGRGNAGTVNLIANDRVSFDGLNSNGFASGIFSQVTSEALGNGGSINMTTDSLLVTNGAVLSASTNGQGNAGNINIRATDRVSFDAVATDGSPSRASSQVQFAGVGNGGSINIITDFLSVTNGAQLSAATFGQGDAGSVNIQAGSNVSLDGVGSNQFPSGVFSTVELGAIGKGGDVKITTDSLLVTNGAQLGVSTLGEGNAGILTIQATGIVSFDGVGSNGKSSGAFSTVQSGAFGNGGSIELTSKAVSVINGAQISASTEGDGKAGSIRVNTNNFTASSGGQLSTTTATNQDAGDIIVQVQDSIFLSDKDTGLFANTQVGATGKGGSIFIDTGMMTMEDNARVAVNSQGSGKSGNIELDAKFLLLDNQALITAETQSSVGGNLTLGGLDSLQVNNSNISASTVDGTAGSLNVNARESVLLRGTAGLSVEATQGGIAGNLTVKTGQLRIEDEAQINVNSPQGQAGNVDITANSLTMNRGRITATTGVGQGEGGANINLELSNSLIMDNESLISANALENANGGNINLNTEFLIVSPPQGTNGSNITANAVRGSGGQVNINTQGIFGIELRPEESPFNDITASSEFGVAGIVQINRPDVDPSQGLVDLPTEPLDASRLIVQGCSGSGRTTASKQGEFFITGSGGLPPSPNQPFNGNAVWNDIRPPAQQATNQPIKTARLKDSNEKQIVEAQGWEIGKNGQITLTAQIPHITPQNPGLIGCRPSNEL